MGMTLSECNRAASNKGYTYFAMQCPACHRDSNKAACLGGNGSYAKYGSALCSSKDSNGNYLGESWVNAVYLTGVTVQSSVPPAPPVSSSMSASQVQQKVTAVAGPSLAGTGIPVITYSGRYAPVRTDTKYVKYYFPEIRDHPLSWCFTDEVGNEYCGQPVADFFCRSFHQLKEAKDDEAPLL